ncbi:hypothetical protein B0O99DRAFT_591742 [Bisporella sp. PMI_857]|nr:hypothetical protein B0O99DRAFT_591742 [Bisporella sp. PMI_857]
MYSQVCHTFRWMGKAETGTWGNAIILEFTSKEANEVIAAEQLSLEGYLKKITTQRNTRKKKILPSADAHCAAKNTPYGHSNRISQHSRLPSTKKKKKQSPAAHGPSTPNRQTSREPPQSVLVKKAEEDAFTKIRGAKLKPGIKQPQFMISANIPKGTISLRRAQKANHAP